MLLKMSSLKDIFQGFAIFRDSLQFFGNWVNTYLVKHLLMTASARSRFIDVIRALLSGQTKNPPT